MFPSIVRSAPASLAIARQVSLVALVLASLLAAGACSGADFTKPSAVNQSDAIQVKPGVQLVPIKAGVYGYSFPMGNGVAVGCPVSYNRTGIDLSGDVSHLGATTLSTQHCNRTLSANPLVVDVSGGGAMTAANGDALAFTYVVTSAALVGPSEPTGVDFNIALTFTGGTGRFEGASGSGTLLCRRTTPPAGTLPAHTPAYTNIYDCALDGEVSTVGSSKE